VGQAACGGRLALIECGKKLKPQLFPWDGHCSTGIQILHAAGDFFVPRLFYRVVCLIKTVEESVWPGPRIPRREATERVLEGRKLRGSYAYPKPWLGIFKTTVGEACAPLRIVPVASPEGDSGV